MTNWKNLTVTAGIIVGTSLGVTYLYKHSKSYWYNIYEKSPWTSSSRVTPRELMTVGGVTSIVGFALTFMNKESLDKLFNKDVKELTEAGFVKPKKAGRTKALFLTDKFNRYFEQKKVNVPSVAVVPNNMPIDDPSEEAQKGSPEDETSE